MRIATPMVKVYALGTAGSGKSTFIAAMAEWMEKNGFRFSIVNLDPGAEEIPYEPDVDIRDWFTLTEVMKQHKLGPNGAQVAAADMIAIHIPEIRDRLESTVYDYALIDTPGQLELFAFREASAHIVEQLGSEDALLAFIFDPILAKTPEGFASLLMLSSTVHFRFYLPFLNLLGKADLLTQEERDMILEWGSSDESLYNALRESKGMRANMSLEVFKALELLGAYRKLIPMSAYDGEGMEDVYSIAQQIFGAGEDLSPE